jgi:N-acyl-D-aspartate/D-glutamate deacylase
MGAIALLYCRHGVDIATKTVGVLIRKRAYIMRFDVIFAGGMVADGSGKPLRRADIGIVDDRIAAVDVLTGAQSATNIDCTGLTVAPGFIDIHTHYDPQILWDRELTPSSWYGVTTTVLGNCGFSIAPMAPGSRAACVDILSGVEAMSPQALNAGISWEFESFADYLRALERRAPTLNVAALVGHTALRLSELGAAAARPATNDEIDGMRRALEVAMAAGAWGFSTSKSASHVAGDGKPAPSRLSSSEELNALADVLGAARKGVMQGVGGPGLGVPEFADIAARTGRPVTWCSLHQGVDGGRHWKYSKATAAARANGANLWAQMGCLPIVSQFTLERPYTLEAVPAFAALSGLSRSERARRMSSAAWQSEAERQIAANAEGWTYEIRWDRLLVAESAAHPELVGRSLADIAGPGRSPLATGVELSVEEDFATRFDMILFNWDEDEVAALLKQDSTLLGLSDAGAHASQLCDASFCLHLLGRFVRERRDFPLEFGVWRLTGHPAEVFGIKDRGLLEKGRFADVCVFDAGKIGETPKRRVYDLPAGADRVIKDSIGIEHVMVNGRFIRRDGKPLMGVGAGRIIRS